MSDYLSKQRLLIGTAVLILVALVVWSASLIYNKSLPETTEHNISEARQEVVHNDFHGDLQQDNVPLDSRSDRVFIKDFRKFEDSIDLDTQRYIEQRLYMAAVRASRNDPGLYTGVVRSGSYSSVSSANFNTIKLLVDIEPAKLTYEVTIARQKNGGDMSVYIACATDEQKMSESSMCRQGAA